MVCLDRVVEDEGTLFKELVKLSALDEFKLREVLSSQRHENFLTDFYKRAWDDESEWKKYVEYKLLSLGVQVGLEGFLSRYKLFLIERLKTTNVS